jgi:hypothetical protein
MWTIFSTDNSLSSFFEPNKDAVWVSTVEDEEASGRINQSIIVWSSMTIVSLTKPSIRVLLKTTWLQERPPNLHQKPKQQGQDHLQYESCASSIIAWSTIQNNVSPALTPNVEERKEEIQTKKKHSWDPYRKKKKPMKKTYSISQCFSVVAFCTKTS